MSHAAISEPVIVSNRYVCQKYGISQKTLERIVKQGMPHGKIRIREQGATHAFLFERSIVDTWIVMLQIKPTTKPLTIKQPKSITTKIIDRLNKRITPMPLPIDRDLIAIDPGTHKSAMLVWKDGEIDRNNTGEYDNAHLLSLLGSNSLRGLDIACEGIASYGMAVGKETFDTCIWIGRFMEKWEGMQMSANMPKPFTILYRPDVKMAICHSMRAKDASIRRALLDMFPSIGGGAVPQVGTKVAPGPLYGVSKHVWSALAVGVTYCIKNPLK